MGRHPVTTSFSSFPAVSQSRGVEYGIDRLFLRGFYECASVYENDLRLGHVVRERIAAFRQQIHQVLCIDAVLIASQRYDRDLFLFAYVVIH